MTDPYTTLNVPRDASLEQIKAAYRDLAKRWHPDVGGNPEAFARLQQAYETLSDPDERAYYDQHGARRRGGGIDAVDAKAREFFAKVLLEALDDPFAERRDVLSRALGDIQRDRAKIRTEIADMSRKRERAEKLALRFRAKDGRGTLPNDIYGHFGRQVAMAIAQSEERLKVLARLEELVNAYTYEVDADPNININPLLRAARK